MRERKIVKIQLVDTDTEIGQLLAAAIAKITTESQTDKTPDQVLEQLHELADHMFADRQDSIYIESMTSVSTPNGPIRCWRMEESEGFDQRKTEEEIMEVVNSVQKETGMSPDIMSWQQTYVLTAKRILSLPRMNAVEVLDFRKNGIVLYKNWP